MRRVGLEQSRRAKRFVTVSDSPTRQSAHSTGTRRPRAIAAKTAHLGRRLSLRPIVSADKPLTPLEAAFVREYQADQNGTQAAIRAGASQRSAGVTAARWLKKANVVAALAATNAIAIQRVQEAQQAAVASAEWIIAKAVEVVDIGLAATPVRGRDGKVIEDAEGNPRDYEAYSLGSAVSALSLLAKRHPEFRDGPLVDQSQHLHLPEGTTLDDLRALRDGLRP